VGTSLEYLRDRKKFDMAAYRGKENGGREIYADNGFLHKNRFLLANENEPFRLNPFLDVLVCDCKQEGGYRAETSILEQ
jgi:hypothetical protein